MAANIIAISIMILTLLMVVGVFWYLYRFIRSIPETIREGRKTQQARLDQQRNLALAEDEVRDRAGAYLYESSYSTDIIALNPQTREMILGSLRYPIYFSFDTIRHAEIVRGGVTLTKTDRRPGQGWINGTASGDAYAIREAVRADRLSRDLITDLSIKVTIDDWNNPVHMVCFLQVDHDGVDPRSPEGASAVALVEKIYAQLEMIIHENEARRPAISDQAAADRPIA